MDAVARTESGAVQGETGDGYLAFRAIPYAAPLLGPLRFQAPAPAWPWDGVRDAREFGSSVPQPVLWRPGDDSECLTVNVWTPDLAAAGLPVLVWLHGGACLGGTAVTPDFDGAAYARAGIVLVTVNYRVGYEGFGWVDDAPANRGVLDQIAALRWVHHNISGFGGDPAAVTLIGQSAGASSVAALTARDAAAGLFRRGIAQSPGRIFVPAAEARTVSTMITDHLGIPPTVDALAAVPSETIQAVQMTPVAIMSGDPARWTLPNAPYSLIIDGELIESAPWTRIRPPTSVPLPDLVCGYTTDEARMFTVEVDLSTADPADTARACGLDPDAVHDYRAGRPGIDDADLHALILSDALFRIPALWCAEAHANAGANTYLYEFAWRSPARDGALGACHGLDVPFTFDTPHSPLGADLIGSPVPPDFSPLSAEMRNAFIAFATTGDPGWPKFDTGDRIRRIWKSPPALGRDSLHVSRRIWRDRHPAASQRTPANPAQRPEPDA
ncbi:carboxylesterase family protein [Nocardia sp. NPDC050193]